MRAIYYVLLAAILMFGFVAVEGNRQQPARSFVQASLH